MIRFSKGHVEEGETEEETTVRECMEETNTKVRLVDGFREEMGYYWVNTGNAGSDLENYLKRAICALSGHKERILKVVKESE